MDSMMKTLSRWIRTVAEDAELFGADGPCPVAHEKGKARILLITGDNASGKSLVCKYMRQLIREDKVEVMDGGMHRRTTSGFERAFMYGDENRDSTGNLSMKFVRTGLRTCQSRETPHVLMLDEPDVGLSEGYQAALGEMLAQFAAALPEQTTLVIVTHARVIVERLMPFKPHCFRVGDDRRPTAQWIKEGPLPRSVADLENLGQQAMERSRAIQAVINSRKDGSSR